MPPILPEDRFSGIDPDHRTIMAYAKLRGSGSARLEDFWASLDANRTLMVLSKLVKFDLEERFRQGERPRAAEYLERFPELKQCRDRVVSIVYEEFCLLVESGGEPDSDEFCEGYGPWRDSLVSQLHYHRELSRIVGLEDEKPRFPSVGERFANYHLRSVLGSGGAAMVYMATDDRLSGRRVALKISGSFGHEPSILAILDHRNIVPILDIVSEEGRDLRAFSMPYRPGVTLDKLIRAIGSDAVPARALALWEALTPPMIDGKVEPEGNRVGWLGFPIHGTYSEAVAWIGLTLAHALSYMHQREIFHRDIKPANILLSFEEGLQILDFNLSDDRNSPERAHAALRGGTLPYMAPEQLRAFKEPQLWSTVDGPADLYSLGLVLREMVTGKAPELPARSRTLPRTINALDDRRQDSESAIRRVNPDVPMSLESIILKCLAFEKADRYLKAEDLAEDLQRFLDRRPLKSAQNRSLKERLGNALYRNRSLIIGTMLVLVVLLASRLNPSGSRSEKAGDVKAESRSLLETEPEFQRAVQDFKSDRSTLRERAKASFERLKEKSPKSALPLIYLSLIWQSQDAQKAKDLMQAALTQCPDAKSAVASLLADDPQSSTLLVAKSWLLYHREKKYGEATEILLSVNKRDPDHLGALMLLGWVEYADKKTALAIPHVEKAIRLVNRDDTGLKDRIDLRSFLLILRNKQLKSRLKLNPSPEDQKLAQADLDSLQDTLIKIQEDWAKIKAGSKVEPREFMLGYYGSVIESGLGVLDAENGRKTSASVHFKQAFDKINYVRTLDFLRLDSNRSLQHEVEEERNSVKGLAKGHGVSLESP